MFNYFRYVQQNIFKHKSIWVSVGLYWLYLFLILIFVPWIVNISPTALWDNSIMDLQSFSTLILSIVCSILAVVIFREGRDDGSELIIISKSVSRWKMILVKFGCFLLTVLLTTIISMIIMVGVLFFGKYDSVTNPNGVEFKEVLIMEMGLLLATIIISLFFGSIAILISTVASKVIIMISTIGAAVIFNVIYMLVPILSITADEYLSDQYSIDLLSTRYMGIDGQMHDVTTSNHVRYMTDDDHDNPNNNWNTIKYVNEGNAHSTGSIISYINISQQLSTLFHTFDNTTATLDHSPFGQVFNHKYWLTQQNNIFTNADTNSRPWISWSLRKTEGVNNVRWTMFGNDLNLLSIHAVAGATGDSIFYIRPVGASVLTLTSTKFYSFKDFMDFPNEAAQQKVREYVDRLETSNPDLDNGWYGYNKNILVGNPYGNKNVIDLRRQFTVDLFENKNSDIYYDNPDFPLPYKVRPNDPAYDDAMNADFFTIYYLIMQDMQTKLWKDINAAILLNATDQTKGLPPFNAWTDKGEDSIYERLDELGPFADDESLIPLREARECLNYNYINWIGWWLYSYTTCYAFSTNKDSRKEDQNYANPNFIMLNMYQDFSTSDVFTSTFAYAQKPYYTSTNLTIFWATFALILFGVTALVYARTDIK